jgi:aminoglycoside phosphotransferase family enzyme/predicted kinase
LAEQSDRAVNLGTLIAELSAPGFWPGADGPVEVRQTHASVVFLAGESVWKLKKPVNLGFLDYSTPRKRALSCRREVELNRRLAPDVYLGLARLRATDRGGFRLGGRGRVVDTLVRMRRLDDSRSLAALLERGTAGDTEVREVARALGRFHLEAAPASRRLRTPAVFERNLRDNFAQFDGGPAKARIARELRRNSREMLQRLAEVRGEIRMRTAGDRFRDAHGDLRMEHIFFDPDFAAIDCIEFNARYRHQDIALDIAFLAMDIETSGFPDLAISLLDEWRSVTDDRSSERLMRLYVAYRSLVRAKVSHLRSGEREVPPLERDLAAVETLANLRHARRLLGPPSRQPWLIVMCGLTGSGKSWAARIAARVAAARVLNADQTRKGLAGLGAFEHTAGESLYSPEMNVRVYRALLEGAGENLSAGRSVILDGTYQRRPDRAAALALARQAGARVAILFCEAPEAVVRRRLAARVRGPGDPWSDGDEQVYELQVRAFEPLDERERGVAARLDTTHSSVRLAAQIVDRLDEG